MQIPLSTIIEMVGISAIVAAAVALSYERLVHLPHLRQAAQEHRRLCRLSIRLAGCVVELERNLERGLPVPGPGLLPDSVAGHMNYLFGIRDECDQIWTRTTNHNARISWAQSFLTRASVTSRRCSAAQAALGAAAEELAQAARRYEEGFVAVHSKRAGVGGSRAPSQPLLMLSQKRASEIVVHRNAFEAQMRLAATHAGLRHPLLEHYKSTWPVMTSETNLFGDDPYFGEVRPMGHHGFGPVPVLHPDAR